MDMINQDENNKIVMKETGRQSLIYKRTHHEPTHKVISLSEFKRVEVHEKHQYKEIPYIDMKLPVMLLPLTADITDTADLDHVFYPKYQHEGRIFVDDRAWEISDGVNTFYVVLFDLSDPTYGLFGALGGWTPYQTVLYDANKEPISEHSETGNADHIRTKQCITTESMIRHLTVWGMVGSTYGKEISVLNDELRECYNNLIKVNKRIIDIYCQREAIHDPKEVNIYSIGNDTYEELLDRNSDL